MTRGKKGKRMKEWRTKKYKERKKEENRRKQRKEDRKIYEKNCRFSLLLFYPISYHLIIPNLKNPHGITLPMQCEEL